MEKRVLLFAAVLALTACQQPSAKRTPRNHQTTSTSPRQTDLDGDGLRTEDGDCNDSDPSISPNEEEIPGNGVDENCYPGDDDIDGDGTSTDDGDCDDGDASVHPGATEITGNKIDENCDSGDDDRDADGLSEDQGDCNDGNSSIHPGATEIPNSGIDEDCVGGTSSIGCAGGEYTLVQSAVDHAGSSCPTYSVCAGYYHEAVTVSRCVKLRANGDVYFGGSANSRPLLVTNGGELTLTDIVVEFGYTTGNGGGMKIENGGSAKVIGGTFGLNGAGGVGGAIAVDAGGSLEVDDTIFGDNGASKGGAIATAGDVIIKPSTGDVTFTNNDATYGGLAYVYGGSLTVDDSNHQIGLDGGVASIFVDSGYVWLQGTNSGKYSVTLNGLGTRFLFGTKMTADVLITSNGHYEYLQNVDGVCGYDSGTCIKN